MEVLDHEALAVSLAAGWERATREVEMHRPDDVDTGVVLEEAELGS